MVGGTFLQSLVEGKSASRESGEIGFIQQSRRRTALMGFLQYSGIKKVYAALMPS